MPSVVEFFPLRLRSRSSLHPHPHTVAPPSPHLPIDPALMHRPSFYSIRRPTRPHALAGAAARPRRGTSVCLRRPRPRPGALSAGPRGSSDGHATREGTRAGSGHRRATPPRCCRWGRPRAGTGRSGPSFPAGSALASRLRATPGPSPTSAARYGLPCPPGRRRPTTRRTASTEATTAGVFLYSISSLDRFSRAAQLHAAPLPTFVLPLLSVCGHSHC